MNDELDPALLRVFAGAEVRLETEPFVAQAQRRLMTLRRTRRSQRWAVVIVLLALAALVGPYLISVSLALNDYLAALLLTPWGWGASILAGALMVWRSLAVVRMQ